MYRIIEGVFAGVRSSVFCPVHQTLAHWSLLQATAEQIRLAQMIYDKNDADFEDKVNQVSIQNRFGRQYKAHGQATRLSWVKLSMTSFTPLFDAASAPTILSLLHLILTARLF